MIYLDNAATTWPKPESVYKAVEHCIRLGGSAGRGQHQLANKANYLLYETREKLACLFNIADPNRIVIANNATDALNMALLGVLCPGETVITTCMEHNSVSRPLRWLEKKGVKLEILKVDAQGQINLSILEEKLGQQPKAVIMSHASNVTGAVMPIQQIGELARKYHVLFIVDAAQTAGSRRIDVQQQYIDILAFSGHKSLLGPQGTGGLYVKSGVGIRPVRFGGTGSQSEYDIQPDFLPDMLETGTMNMPGIAGLSAGVSFVLETGVDHIASYETDKINHLIEGLLKIKNVTVYLPHIADRTSVVSFNITGLDSNIVAYQLEQEYEIICRAGLHCAPWAHQALETVQTGTIRLSPGYFTTTEEIEKTIQAIQLIGRRMGN